MGRPLRAAGGGLIYHARNRANARLEIFTDDGDDQAFLRVLTDAVARHDVRLLAYCLIPNHFHRVVWPRGNGDLSRFLRWLTLTHTQRWHAHRHSAGSGHLSQGRFQSVVVQEDCHLDTVCRTVERNALEAGLVPRAEDWRWGSLHPSIAGAASAARPERTPWPIERPADWVARVNPPLSPAEEEALQRSLRRGQPFGEADGRTQRIARLGLESTVRPLGRPQKPKIGS